MEEQTQTSHLPSLNKKETATWDFHVAESWGNTYFCFGNLYSPIS